MNASLPTEKTIEKTSEEHVKELERLFLQVVQYLAAHCKQMEWKDVEDCVCSYHTVMSTMVSLCDAKKK
jgi:hypothetical protein